MNTETFTVMVKPAWADRGKPAVWYCEQGGKNFTVKQSDKYKEMYEVTDGPFTGKIIEKAACLIQP